MLRIVEDCSQTCADSCPSEEKKSERNNLRILFKPYKEDNIFILIFPAKYRICTKNKNENKNKKNEKCLIQNVIIHQDILDFKSRVLLFTIKIKIIIKILNFFSLQHKNSFSLQLKHKLHHRRSSVNSTTKLTHGDAYVRTVRSMHTSVYVHVISS